MLSKRPTLRLALLLGLLAASASAQDRPRLVPQDQTLWLPDLNFSTDGDRLLTVNRTGGAALWDVATGAALLTVRGQDGRPSPDAAALLQHGADWRLSLWDLAQARELQWLGRAGTGGATAAFVGSDRLAVAPGDGTAAIHDVRTGREIAALEGWSPAWALDSFRSLPGWAAGRDTTGHVRLWDAATGAPAPGLDDAWEWAASADGARVLATFDPPGRPGRWEVWAGRPLTLRLRVEAADLVRADDALARVLIAEGARVRVVDLDAGTEADGPVHAGPVREAALSADGGWAATLDRIGAFRAWEVASGAVAVEAVPTGEAPWAVAIARAGGLAAVAADDGSRVWDLAMGHEVLRVSGTVSFGPAGRHAVTEVLELERWSYTAVDVWDPATGARTRLTDAGTSPTFSADGRHLALETPAGVDVWEVATGRPRSALRNSVAPVARAAFGPDGRRLLTAALPADSSAGGQELQVYLWEGVGSGAPRRIGEPFALSMPPTLSPDGTRVLAVGGEDGTVRVWDAATGETRAAWGGGGEHALAAGWAAAGGLAVVAADGALGLRDVETGDVLRPLAESRGDPLTAALSPDGRRVAAAFFEGSSTSGEFRFEEAQEGRELRVWDAETSDPVGRPQALPGLAASVAFDPTGERLVTAQVGGAVRLWEVTPSVAGPVLDGHLADTATSAAFSPDGRRVLSTGRDGVVRTWDAATGAPGPTFDGYGGPVDARVFSPDGRRAVTPRDGGAAVWDIATGAELARLLLLADGSWLVVTPDGRFDAPDLEAITGAVWVAPDDPLTPLPIEAFMADFYEPRLLARVLAGEAFPDMGRLLDRNRVQPTVEITSTEAVGDGTATVTVRVVGEARTYGGTERASGVHDLRLFRDGKLVAWRDGPLVDGTGRQTVTVEGVSLPSDADTVRFSAYAFNVDRVKSRTARATLAVPPSASPRRPRRAFVVSLGVDAFADPAWDLAFAAADARATTAALGATLTATADYDEVVTVALVSDGTANHGTAAALRGSLLRLAGAPLDADAEAALATVPNADRLVDVTPDDAVILTVSTHGYAGPDGVFYLLPSDVPETGRQLTPALLDAAVSSDELSAWLRGVDAGALAVVVDACNAAGAVEGTGFKPGPMGARGLGQLAFDKGAAVLTATQADAPALEAQATGRGLLTFALVDNGLLAGRSDGATGDVPDGRITLAEWLAYGAARVPGLAAEVRDGAVETYGRGGVQARQMTDEEAPSDGDAGLQTPALFDFRTDPRPVPLATVSASEDG